MTFRVLTINPGSTSTEVGLFCDEKCVSKLSGDAEPAGRILDELPARRRIVERVIDDSDFDFEQLDAVAARGGLLPPVRSGTYRVDDKLVALSRASPRGEHASNLGAILAGEIADRHDVDAFVVDPVSVDEMDDIARISGLDGIERESLCHALNIRAVAHRFAEQRDIQFDELRAVVAHLGTGVSIAAIRNGRMVDVVNPRDEGPMGLDRPGSLPNRGLMDLMDDPNLSRADVDRQILGNGGVYSYLGTRDLRELIELRRRDDESADLIFRAMIADIARWVAATASVLCGRLDAVVLTGGMAHSELFVESLRRRIDWIGPCVVFAGSDELLALAEGALRVLRNEETARSISEVADCATLITEKGPGDG